MYDKFLGYSPNLQPIYDEVRMFIFDPNPRITLTPLAKYKGRKNSQRHKTFR